MKQLNVAEEFVCLVGGALHVYVNYRACLHSYSTINIELHIAMFILKGKHFIGKQTCG